MENLKEVLTCSICGNEIESNEYWSFGHNAQPINDGRCCDDCNATVVIQARIEELEKQSARKLQTQR